MPHFLRATAIACGLAFAFSAQAKPTKSVQAATAAPVEVELANQLGDVGEENLRKVVEEFNSQQKGMAVKLVRLAQGARPAQMNLVRRQDLSEFMTGKNAFRPLYQVMSETRTPFAAASLSPDLKAGVADERGRLVGLPVAYSTPVLFYNKNAFRKAGLDPDKPPRTWAEMQDVAGKLADAGSQCPYTSSWPAWIHIDNLSALSGVPVASPKGELDFNGLPQVKHIAMLATWSKARYFRSFGPRNEADEHFLKGECAMITTDSWAHTAFREAQGVELGVAPLPYHEDVYGGRQHTLADGAALWVGGGYKPQEYKVVAKFVAFLLAPDREVELAQTYGQLPLTQAARNALRSKAERDRDQTLGIAYISLKGEGATHPLRVSAIEPVRAIIDEELDAVWSNKEPAKAALDNAVTRGNSLLASRPLLKKVLPF